MSVRSDLWVLAVHEAGHVVAALALGATFREVSLLPTSEWDAAMLDLDAPTYVASLLTVLAGTVAETMLAPAGDLDVHAVSDRLIVRRLLPDAAREAGYDDHVAAALGFGAQARELVVSHSKQIRRVASRLMDRQSLDYDEVRALLPALPAPVLAAR